MTTEWAFTVKWNCILKDRQYVEKERYNEWFTNCTKYNVLISKLCFEKDNTDLLHCHGIMKCTKNFWMKKLYIPGYHTNFEKIYNEYGWIRYCMKDQLPPLEDIGPEVVVSDGPTVCPYNIDKDDVDIMHDDYHVNVNLKPSKTKKKISTKIHKDIIKKKLFTNVITINAFR